MKPTLPSCLLISLFVLVLSCPLLPAVAGGLGDLGDRLGHQAMQTGVRNAEASGGQTTGPALDLAAQLLPILEGLRRQLRQLQNERLAPPPESGRIADAPPAVEAPPASGTAGESGTVTASVLNLRSGVWGEILGKLPSGTSLTVLEKKDGWYRIQTADGQSGWVSGRYVSLAGGDTSSVETSTPAAPPTAGTPGGDVAPGTGRSLRVQTTGYYPPPAGGYSSSREARMEGGALDCRGNRLRTLQDYRPGSYVSVATDPRVIRTGTYFTIDEYPGIRFLACDVGGGIKGNHIDICVRDRAASYRVTGTATIRYL